MTAGVREVSGIPPPPAACEDRSAGLLFRRASSYSKTHRPRPGGTSGPCMVEENGIA